MPESVVCVFCFLFFLNYFKCSYLKENICVSSANRSIWKGLEVLNVACPSRRDTFPDNPDPLNFKQT